MLLKLRDLIYSRFYKSDDPRYRRVATGLLWISQRCANVFGVFSGNLKTLALMCGTDKIGGHQYASIYQALFRHLRWKKISLLEIGVGGYADNIGGGSLKMWQAFFRRGAIYGIDVYDKTRLSRGRIKVYQCSQDDAANLRAIAEQIGLFDVIIDDGSHINAHQIKSFEILFPYLKDGGIYVVEDVQTSYWPSFGGGHLHSDAYNASCMHYFKGLVDSVNVAEFLDDNDDHQALDASIVSLAFHHNLIIITKDNTPRQSNMDLHEPSVREQLLRPGNGPDGQAT